MKAIREPAKEDLKPPPSAAGRGGGAGEGVAAQGEGWASMYGEGELIALSRVLLRVRSLVYAPGMLRMSGRVCVVTSAFCYSVEVILELVCLCLGVLLCFRLFVRWKEEREKGELDEGNEVMEEKEKESMRVKKRKKWRRMEKRWRKERK